MRFFQISKEESRSFPYSLEGGASEANRLFLVALNSVVPVKVYNKHTMRVHCVSSYTHLGNDSKCLYNKIIAIELNTGLRVVNNLQRELQETRKV